MYKLFSFLLITTAALGQGSWNKVGGVVASSSQLDSVYRKGNVAISQQFFSPFQNKLLVTQVYDSTDSRGLYVSLNEPYANDTTTVGLATKTTQSHNVLVANNFANFKAGMTFTDVHNSTAEFNYFRGISDDLGFRDGGSMARAAVLKVAGSFGHNGRAYNTTDFDLINLRMFTSNVEDNPATIENFYALRLENFRGVNADMASNTWGVYMQPTYVNNFFGGKVGIGTTTLSHALTISAESEPLKVEGLDVAQDKYFLTTSETGEIHKADAQVVNANFVTVIGDTTMSSEHFLYVHKGGAANYTLPAPNTRTGQTWKIVNVGTGSITLNLPFQEGDQARYTIPNKAGAYGVTIFSDGTQYIALP